jgi:hypothetical protein
MDRLAPFLLVLLIGCADGPPGSAPSATNMLPLVDASIPLGLSIPLQAQVAPGSGGPVVAAGWVSDLEGELTFAEPDESGIAAATHTFDTVGEQVITVTAYDQVGGEGTDSVTVRVRTATAPFLTITSPWEAGTYFAGPVLFEAQVDDVEHPREDLRVTWTEDDVPILEGLVPDAFGVAGGTVSVAEGDHEYEATVTDPDGQTTSDDLEIEVGPPNTDPECSIDEPEGPAERHLGSAVLFRLTLSDEHTDDEDLVWRLESNVDGVLATGPGTGDPIDETISLSDSGHLVTLTVEDGFGGVCTDDVAVTMRDCDLDLDGAIATACGGSDCNDGDPAVAPFAGDLGGDGVDSDCDGMDCGADFATDGTYFAACLPILDHTASEEACQDAGYGGLASVRNAVEELFVLDLAGPFGNSRLWVGLKNATGAWWSWSDGSSSFYRPWIPGQPDLSTFPACAEITYQSGWSDLPCTSSYLNLGLVCAQRP